MFIATRSPIYHLRKERNDQQFALCGRSSPSPSEKLAEFLKARELDPLQPNKARGVCLPYYLKKDYTRALELLRQAYKLGPPLTSSIDVEIYIQNNLFDEAFGKLATSKA